MSFLNPFFLFATSAALLPVLYHFVRNLRARKSEFSSLMLLKKNSKELVKRRRLRDLLLMTLRAAMFALLALAFARPFLPRAQVPFTSGGQHQSVVLLLDNSYSMQHGEAFEAARQEALNLLQAAGPRDEFSVVAFSDEVEQLTTLETDLTRHRSALENQLTLSNRSTNFYPALRRAQDILQDARYQQRKIVLLSDLQQNGWTRSLNNWQLETGITFTPIAVGAERPSNAYIEEFKLTQKRQGEQVTLRYDARVTAQREAASREKDITLSIDGSQAAQKSAPALASSPVTFQEKTSDNRTYRGVLLLEEDALSLDNAYYFTYQVQERPALLAVSDASSSTYSSTFFLQNAFDAGEDARYRFEAAGRQALRQTTLRDKDVVFLSNVSSLTEAQMEALQRYVKEGGGLIISFGEQVDNAAFSDHLRTFGIGQLNGAAVDPASEAIIGEVDLHHPVFEPFATSGMAPIWRPTFNRYVTVKPDTNAAVVGTYDSGDPFLIERQVGQGRVLAYTSTLSTNWTDFPINELFVPFIYQLAGYAARSTDRKYAFTVGEAVTLPGQPGDSWDVRTPDGQQFKVAVSESGEGYFRKTQEPGHYLAARGREQFPFSVNVDARESDLQFRDEEEAFAAVNNPQSPQTASIQSPQMAGPGDEAHQSFWQYLLVVVIGLFVVETLLANRWPRLRRA